MQTFLWKITGWNKKNLQKDITLHVDLQLCHSSKILFHVLQLWDFFLNLTWTIIVDIEKNYMKSVALKQNTTIFAFQCKLKMD